jgi:hypothetical protein
MKLSAPFSKPNQSQGVLRNTAPREITCLFIMPPARIKGVLSTFQETWEMRLKYRNSVQTAGLQS